MDNHTIVIESLKSALIEYINSLEGMYSTYMNSRKNVSQPDVLSETYNKLLAISKKVFEVNNVEQLYLYKKEIADLEDTIELEMRKERLDALTSREKALIERGYDVDDVIRLSYYSEEQVKDAAEVISSRITKGCVPVDDPFCIFIGGQPGCGKTTVSMEVKNNNKESGIVEIGIDNYRTYHPNYLEIEKAIKRHWDGKVPTENDTPGNDIADFTHDFAGRMTDILQVLMSDHKFNIIMEWGMRTPYGPLASMKDLKEKGYKNIVSFIAVHKDVSMEACNIRADVMNDNKHIVRRVPKYFHELAVSTIADSCKTIYEDGYLKDKVVDGFALINRNGEPVWKPGDPGLVSDVYNDWLNNPVHSISFANDPDLAKIAYLNEAYGFHDSHKENVLGSGPKM